ncbi:MAG: protein kinase [Acidobacteriota bacterium]
MTTFPEIPGYKIEKELGHGGMGRIFLAKDEIFNRKVALKILIPAGATYKSSKERFLFEAEILAKLSHKNIVPVYDVGNVGDISYIAVEYLEGQSLKEKIHPHNGERITTEDALRILKIIAGALQYAHDKGLIHRDIKPENILFRKDDTPVIVDFGIAKDFTSEKSLTVTGTSIGTPYYMSPEQIKGMEPDRRNDIYSLGVVLYEMLTGKVPYEASDIITIALKHERDPVPKLPGKLFYLQKLLEKMMAKKQKNRIGSGKEIIQLIDESIRYKEQNPDNIVTESFCLNGKRKFSRKCVLFFIVLIIPLVGGYYYLNNYKSESIIGAQKESGSENEAKNDVSSGAGKITSRKMISNKLKISDYDVRLRSRFWKIKLSTIKRMIKKYNFFDSDLNQEGNFINKYKSRVIKRDKVVNDRATGLMWHQRGSFKPMSLSKAKEWIKMLNRVGYGGFRNWKLPTLEEAMSLLERRKWYGNLHIYKVFSSVQKAIWTGDTDDENESNWIVSFSKGKLRSTSLFMNRSYVRPVRRLK